MDNLYVYYTTVLHSKARYMHEIWHSLPQERMKVEAIGSKPTGCEDVCV